jgi:vanillate monooxygenase ferredoxin subunit
MVTPAGTGTRDAFEVVIARRTTEADGIVSLELVRSDGQRLPPFEAGAHVDVYLDDGVVRQYSLCSDPAQCDRYRLGILREPQSRGGSAAIHQTFVESRTIRISAPRNNFVLKETAAKSILMAGGIGITPLMAMAYRLHRMGAPFILHYCARTIDRAAFRFELEQAAFRDSVFFHYDDDRSVGPFDVAAALQDATADAQLYVCGPEGFMKHVLECAHATAWTAERIHMEYFSREVPLDAGDSTFTVVAQRSGVTVEVGPSETIAQTLLGRGVTVELACEQGICGTCLTRVVAGIPDHRDLYQTEDEKATNAQMTICCSRARSPTLVLDI